MGQFQAFGAAIGAKLPAGQQGAQMQPPPYFAAPAPNRTTQDNPAALAGTVLTPPPLQANPYAVATPANKTLLGQ
ncbi:MAG: hypothetical protein ABSC06_25070 [Rhodopila sp.]|jgi:hypothetical protein